MTTTNITEKMQNDLEFVLAAGPRQVCLFSCFVDGRPTAAICAVGAAEQGDVTITPLFVAVTPDMALTDHDGTAPGPLNKDAASAG